MLKITKILLLLVVFNSIMLSVYADRGVGSKNTKKINFDIKPSAVKNSLNFSLKSGLTYKGSLINFSSSTNSGTNTLVTYKKGNVTYIIPYKQKIIVPEVGKGYTGMKLIIKAN